jgi:uncharacterized protein DUF6011
MREHNYVKKPHTARFLMTFHAAASRAGYPAETEEREALNFLGAQGEAEAEFFYHRGYKVRIGKGFITEKQAKWVVDIAETKANVTENMVKSLSVRLEQGFSRQAASDFIGKYKDWPVKVSEVPAVESREPVIVDAGRYAIMDNGVLKFYRVTKGKGRWAGRTFVDVQASDDFHPIRDRAHRDAILVAIADAPMQAMVRYGHELGVCGKCGRTLTDESSRAAGIGPVCSSR